MPKQIEAQVSKLEGSPLAERGKFAQAYEYTPPEEELVGKRGRLFAVLDITADPEFDTALAGKLIWDTLHEEYFSETEEAPLKALEQAVLSVKARLDNLASSPDETESGSRPELNLAAAVIWSKSPAGEGGVLYLARQGKPTLFLKRVGQVRELLVSEEPSGVTSLMVEDGDVVILGTHAFGKNFPPNALPEISFLEKEFAQGQQVPGLAAVILKLKVRETEKSEVVPKPGLDQEEAKETEKVPFELGQRLKLPSVKGLLERLPKRKEGLPLPADRIKGGVRGLGSNLKTLARRAREGLHVRIARGQEVYMGKKRPEIGLPKVIVALILIFLFSTTFTLWQQRRQSRAEEFNRLLASAEATITEAEELVGFSDERARELWSEAKEVLEKATLINSRSEELASLAQQADSLLDRIEKITPVTEDQLFYDLALQYEGAKGLSLTGKDKTLYVVEEKAGTVLAIERTAPPQVTEAVTDGVGGVRIIAAGGDFLYLLTDQKLYRYNLKTKKKDVPVEFDRYHKVTALDLYLERNIYFLVPSENQIYKFLDLGGSYSRALAWVKETLVLEETVDMTIDGLVWVLLKNGTVLQLLGGKKEPFSIKNLPTPITNPVAIYTRPNFKRLYIADGDRAAEGEPRQGRVAVFEKDGSFVKQFKGEVLTELVDLWVTDDEKLLFLLTKDKIYKIGL